MLHQTYTLCHENVKTYEAVFNEIGSAHFVLKQDKHTTDV